MDVNSDKIDVHYTHLKRSETEREVLQIITPLLKKCGNSYGHEGSPQSTQSSVWLVLLFVRVPC